MEDGSPDDCLALCRRIEASDSRVRVFQHEGGVNKGAPASRNLGMRMATSPYVAFLDADDRFLPERFTKDAQIFAQHPDADGVYNAIGVYYHDDEGRRRFDEQFGSTLTTVRKVLLPKELFPAMVGVSGLLDIGHFHLDGLTVRRTALERMPQLMREDLVIGEDTEFTIRLSFYSNLYPGGLDTPVALRGVHAENRVTRDPHRNFTRLRLYTALSEWAEGAEVGSEVRSKLAKDVATYQVLCATTASERRKAMGILLRNPSLLKRIDVSETAVSLLFGHDSWLTRKSTSYVRWAHGKLWRIKGSTPPIPSNRDR